MVLIAAQPFSPAAQLGVFRGDTGGKKTAALLFSRSGKEYNRKPERMRCREKTPCDAESV